MPTLACGHGFPDSANIIPVNRCMSIPLVGKHPIASWVEPPNFPGEILNIPQLSQAKLPMCPQFSWWIVSHFFQLKSTMSGKKSRYLICASHSLAAATWGHFPWKLVLRQISMLVIRSFLWVDHFDKYPDDPDGGEGSFMNCVDLAQVGAWNYPAKDWVCAGYLR